MPRSLIALALLMSSSLMFSPALAQDTDRTAIAGSGIAPATVNNSAERPIGFATRGGDGGVLVILTASAALPARAVDDSLRSAVEAAVSSARFEGKANSLLSLRGIGRFDRILLVGIGTEDTGLQRWREAAGKAAQELRDDTGAITITGATRAADAGAVALGYALGQYRFDRYKTVGKTAPPTAAVSIITPEAVTAANSWKNEGEALAQGVRLSRDLATEPASIIYPESFVARVSEAFAGVAKVRIEILDEAAMRRLNMGALVGVGQGSQRPSRLMLVEYRGGGNEAPLALVGKGITFDSGGISIKPGLGMWYMKADMSGAASIMGAVLSLARSKASTNVIGVAALAENMPDGNAQRPGDVVRSYSGKTIEVLNTDAEGRLVLADANEYVIATRRPSALVNVATLTGSIVQALDDEFAGLFARSEPLATAVSKAGEASGEPVWRMPLHKNYADDMKSDIADIKHVVEGGRPGAGLGAHFIGFFVDEKTPWAHLDIAGVNWADKAGPLTPKGASGWGVRLLDQLARTWGR